MLIIVSVSAVSSFALDNSYDSNKLDNELALKLDEIEKEEKLTVSIWFDDVDKEQVKNKLYEKCKDKKSTDVYGRSEELLFGEVCDVPVGYRGDYLTYAKEYYKDITQEDFQYVSERKREAYKSEYKTHNQNMLNRLKDILENDAVVTFVSQYAPNVEAEMSKEDVLRVSELENVEDIYLVDTELEVFMDEGNVSTDEVEEAVTIELDDTYFHVTGLDTGRDAFGLTGEGMKVGVIEDAAKLTPEILENENITILKEGVSFPSPSYNNHGNLVAGIMVSKRSDFIGAIPNAHLYYSLVAGGLKKNMEEMLGYGVNAINCSFSFKGESNEFNTYGDFAKWYDHIALQHNVHLILSSGNKGVTGVCDSNTAYNAIVVGNCDKYGVIYDSSSYIGGTNCSYKPDIVAPGTSIFNPIINGETGTSFSAPLVTSAVIQLAQSSPILAANPTLMKSLLISSSEITSGMQNESMYSVVGSDAIALSRKYGAGRLNLTKAYETFIRKGNYITSSSSSNSTGAIFSRNITKVANKTLRFCLTWEKYNTVNEDHESNEANSSALDNFSLTVVTPSGVTYTSNFMHDNKQIVTFNATENGYYSIRVYRQGTSNSNNIIDYSITYSSY